MIRFCVDPNPVMILTLAYEVRGVYGFRRFRKYVFVWVCKLFFGQRYLGNCYTEDIEI